ncbi:MAG: SLBB domain-containing protein [Candidatus Omnitrophica bacterium]|nr:SLBB domain-containing protein [Candidatus Omnitrophota bacterium]
MIKKVLAWIVMISFLMSQGPVVFAETVDTGGIAEKLAIAQKEKIEGKEEIYNKFTCPSCNRDFELKIAPDDLELKKGIKKIICPYDGTEFYPQPFLASHEELQYETVRCPSCGMEFKGYVDVKALLAGQPQMLTCPYDKKKFYFKAEGFNPAKFTWVNLYTVMCPTDKKTFKAYIDPNSQKDLTCPYDGTKFFPTPNLIVSQTGAAKGSKSALGGMAAAGALGAEGGMAISGGAAEDANMERPPVTEEQTSGIENMFSEKIPLNVSKTIKQFGYDIFKPVANSTDNGDNKETAEGYQGGRPDLKLLKDLFGSKQEGIFSDRAEKGGLSIFSTPTEIPVISDYILGPGDTLMITIWGQIQESFPVTIDSEGKILLPKVGPVYLWGLKFNDAENLIKENMLKAYTNIQISISMGRLRGIKVFVLGEATHPGGFTVSALSNSFHGLYAAGGPTKLGSMRRIKLTRKGRPDMPIDLYNMLIKGDNSQEYKLQEGDTLFIPPIGDVVGIAGNVKRPAIYELNGKVRLNEVIEMAGGFSSVGYLQRIQLERIEEHLRKTVLDLEFKSLSDLQKSTNNLELQDGDMVIVFPIIPIRYNFVSITGNVLRTGDYELKPDMRLKDLVDKAGGLLPGTYLERAEISRFKGDKTREIIAVSLTDLLDGREEANIPLKEWDLITIYSKKDIMPDSFVEIDGAVNKAGKYELIENMKLSDLIFTAGGLKRNALMSNAELFRSYPDKGPRIFNIDLNRALAKDSEEYDKNDVILEEGDHLFIREDTTMEEKLIITLSGEFKYPGKYAVEKGTRLSSVIERAGGFTTNAFLDGSYYTRESIKIAQQKMLKKFLSFEQNAMLQEQSSMAIGASNAQIEARGKLVEYRQRLMQDLDALQAPGRILFRMNADMHKFKNSEYDIFIEDGDTLNIPVYPSTVEIVGNVYGPGSAAYNEGKGIDYYINKVGGLTRAADANRIFVIRANGETVSSFVRAVKIRRGDTIIIPEEFKYRTLPGLFAKDLIQVIYQATLGAAVTVAAINAL